jgi:hypothetical protein
MHDRNTGTNLAGTGIAHPSFPKPTSMSPVLGGHECMHETYEQMNKYRDIQTMCDMENENENVSYQNGRQIT